MTNTKIHILQTGYGFVDNKEVYHASATCSLIIADEMKLIVDPGGVWEKEKIKEKLKSLDIKESDIDVVIGTHGHSDHIGNINLFPSAKQIIGFDINVGDVYESHDFKNGVPYILLENKLEVFPTPGHTTQDVSLIIYDTKEYGTVGVCGDLFEKENDEMIWIERYGEWPIRKMLMLVFIFPLYHFERARSVYESIPCPFTHGLSRNRLENWLFCFTKRVLKLKKCTLRV